MGAFERNDSFQQHLSLSIPAGHRMPDQTDAHVRIMVEGEGGHALEDVAHLQGLRVGAPAVEDVMVVPEVDGGDAGQHIPHHRRRKVLPVVL